MSAWSRTICEPSRPEPVVGEELQSPYIVLHVQFDEYVRFDETRPIRPLPAPGRDGIPGTYPFGV